MRLVFRDPTAKTEENPKLDVLHDLIVAPPPGYWDQGGGGAQLDYLTDASKTSLMICRSSRYGISLRFYDEQDSPWLSVEDEGKLLECTELYDEWYVSIGLFLPSGTAWLAVKEFCLTGQRSPKVQWMPASEIPDGGNW
jgi:hypothetical protein